ncbi:hydroxymethylglutaryl-CoA reductase, degradative [Streptococcus ovuberis]|uniref:3-hydroxy-3-methylglutaryl coenzyme A reductase n=1 Tax=Streptococcus ovuberis TaxID=1936207 RepID=A0A7X6MXJ8_9STRE|nr:hydroxymethylglutaryl-CoA reductase, degradative [Streptococcus ovuberis]NKZ19598.1 hydroxymethylglutaryl-CoA reductase, degradative [Streptococcus ovuberis]
MSLYSGFHKKTRQERIHILTTTKTLTPDSIETLTIDRNLPEDIAGQIAENHIGTFALPMSVVPEIVVNGRTYTLPLVTEEPSVVAALNYASQIIGKSGGFTTNSHERLMIGQVALYDLPDLEKAKVAIRQHQTEILDLANASHPSILKRGGGARAIRLDTKEDFLIVYLLADVKEAMGANMINNMLEGIKPYLVELSNGQALMAILSNYATESLVTATCRIAFDQIPGGQETARKMALASRLAQIDPYRAATHNKGIFNGIDALVLATGNDWRAIEAGCHAYACQDGQYRGLSNWTIEDTELVGNLTVPMPIATVGGSIGLNPKVKLAFDLLQHPDAKTLAGLIAAVGLAQNFAALRALVTTGIQAGHMKLQAKSLALLAGAKGTEVEAIAQKLRDSQHTNLEQAKTLLEELRASYSD